MAVDAERIRNALIRSLRAEPLLIRAEETLHSHGDPAEQANLRASLSQLLDPGPAIADGDRHSYRGVDDEVINRFRAAMRHAVRGGANLADAEEEILESLGLQKLGELRSTVESRLDEPAEIPDRDLAIYVPVEKGRAEELKRALEEQLPAPSEAEPEPISAPPSKREVELIGTPATPGIEAEDDDDLGQLRASLGVSEDTEAFTIEKRRTDGLNPVPMLTAALEAIGLDGDSFGFLLRYGRYASEGRKSEFLVGGLGLADLSKRLTLWLDAHGPLDGQVQVIDEGSGELTIYLLGQEQS